MLNPGDQGIEQVSRRSRHRTGLKRLQLILVHDAGSQRSVLRGASPAGTPRSSKSVQFGLPSSFAGGLKMPKVRIPMSGKS